ncbi:Coenzyme F420 hydrogenase/dehydrogenase, beta subunit C-terminal domain [Streptomyces sp. NPDC048473]|uniref:Coenzyme F420 hydrogenase/dehydrogenase, beta subunit C-terminal domain n=1 Tax=unclassified Streptomyces TaxID=2593676 RepID=UPI003714F360
MRTGFADLHHAVLKTDLCSYCGACVPACPVDVLSYAKEQPVIDGSCASGCRVCFDVCPENRAGGTLLQDYMADHRPDEERQLVGRLTDPDLLARTGSGGLTTGLALYLLESGRVDGVVMTGFGGDSAWEPRPLIATTRSEVIAASGPKYALSPTLSVLDRIAEEGHERVMLVGLPCHIESLRQLQAAQDRLEEGPRRAVRAITHAVGLWCGNNFRTEGTERFISAIGVDPDRVTEVGYTRRDGRLEFSVSTPDGSTGTPFGQYLGYLLAGQTAPSCQGCRRWHAAYADVSVGGLDTPGLKWSGFMVQTREGHDLVSGAEAAGYITVQDMSSDERAWLARKNQGSRGFGTPKPLYSKGNQR